MQLLLADPRTAMNQACTDDGTTPLHIAVYQGHLICVRLFLADPRTDVNNTRFDGASPLLVAALNGHSEIVELLLMDDVPTLIDQFFTWRGLVTSSLLCNAAFSSRLPVFLWKFIFSFLRPRTNVNQVIVTEGLSAGLVRGSSALWLASSKGHTACVEHLLAHRDTDVFQPDAAGRTPLQMAQEGGHAACVALLAARQKACSFSR